jgi:hypothetical protein
VSEVVEIPTPVPGPGEVLVAVGCIPVPRAPVHLRFPSWQIAQLDETDHERLARRMPVATERIGKHQPLPVDHFEELAGIADLFAARTFHHHQARSPGADILFGVADNPRLGALPLQLKRIGCGVCCAHDRLSLTMTSPSLTQTVVEKNLGDSR